MKMGEVGREKRWRRRLVGLLMLFQLFLLTESTVRRQKMSNKNFSLSPPVQLHISDEHAVVDNGFAKITFSTPGGMITGIQYNGIDNILDEGNRESNRGYWDIVWTNSENHGDNFDKLEGTRFKIIMQDEGQVELSFTKEWQKSTGPPLNIDKRYIILRGIPGFYSYAIFERPEGWRDMIIYEGRIAFKLQKKLFRYMAVSDQRQRIMPTFEDREKGKPLAYPEAVLLTNASSTQLIGEVDDKYQYSAENKDNKVHGWICSDPPTGFWMITPSTEFRSGGPHKQDLTSHAGPVTLSMFFSTHYAGKSLGLNFSEGEAWKKVLGPVFIYLNSVPHSESPLTLWNDAKEQMMIETESWPYDFPRSKDYHYANQRGIVGGRLLVRDSYINRRLMPSNHAYVGLAPPGEIGSWQRENKGYQFWTKADVNGHFLIKNILPGNYSLYAWVPGFIGDYKYDFDITITPGSRRGLGNIVYTPPRNGATLWEIGYPDRTAAEFFVPGPRPTLMNKLYEQDSGERFRQYGLWDRYSDFYPMEDLVYNTSVDDHRIDWFFAHVNRRIENQTYVPTTWKILFDLKEVQKNGTYTLRLALASSNGAELQVRINDEYAKAPHFTTGLIGRDNAIARHGIHGLYNLYSVDFYGSHLQMGRNTIFLTQSRGAYPFSGVMYDYIRLEQPGIQVKG